MWCQSQQVTPAGGFSSQVLTSCSWGNSMSWRLPAPQTGLFLPTPMEFPASFRLGKTSEIQAVTLSCCAFLWLLGMCGHKRRFLHSWLCFQRPFHSFFFFFLNVILKQGSIPLTWLLNYSFSPFALSGLNSCALETENK